MLNLYKCVQFIYLCKCTTTTLAKNYHTIFVCWTCCTLSNVQLISTIASEPKDSLANSFFGVKEISMRTHNRGGRQMNQLHFWYICFKRKERRRWRGKRGKDDLHWRKCIVVMHFVWIRLVFVSFVFSFIWIPITTQWHLALRQFTIFSLIKIYHWFDFFAIFIIMVFNESPSLVQSGRKFDSHY